MGLRKDLLAADQPATTPQKVHKKEVNSRLGSPCASSLLESTSTDDGDQAGAQEDLCEKESRPSRGGVQRSTQMISDLDSLKSHVLSTRKALSREDTLTKGKPQFSKFAEVLDDIICAIALQKGRLEAVQAGGAEAMFAGGAEAMFAGGGQDYLLISRADDNRMASLKSTRTPWKLRKRLTARGHHRMLRRNRLVLNGQRLSTSSEHAALRFPSTLNFHVSSRNLDRLDLKPQPSCSDEEPAEVRRSPARTLPRNGSGGQALIWTWTSEEGPALCVEVSGTFLEPQWQKRISLWYCEIQNVFWIDVLESVPSARPGIVQFKFIVDGEWRCHPNYPICDDGSRQHNWNNVCVICPVRLRLRLSDQKLRRCHSSMNTISDLSLNNLSPFNNPHKRPEAETTSAGGESTSMEKLGAQGDGLTPAERLARAVVASAGAKSSPTQSESFLQRRPTWASSRPHGVPVRRDREDDDSFFSPTRKSFRNRWTLLSGSAAASSSPRGRLSYPSPSHQSPSHQNAGHHSPNHHSPSHQSPGHHNTSHHRISDHLPTPNNNPQPPDNRSPRPLTIPVARYQHETAGSPAQCSPILFDLRAISGGKGRAMSKQCRAFYPSRAWAGANEERYRLECYRENLSALRRQKLEEVLDAGTVARAPPCVGGTTNRRTSLGWIRAGSTRTIGNFTRLSRMTSWPKRVTDWLYPPEVLIQLELPFNVIRKTFTNLTLSTGWAMSPKPDKLDQGGDDAFYVSEDMKCMAVADGVGEWDSLGFSPQSFADELMMGIQEVWEDESHPVHRLRGKVRPSAIAKKLMEAAYQKPESYGSATCCILVFDDLRQQIGICNLGDSGVCAFRKSSTYQMTPYFRTPDMCHFFNCPYQLSKLPPTSILTKMFEIGSVDNGNSFVVPCMDEPKDSQCFDTNVMEGDLILIGTDGLWDNLWPAEISSVANLSLTPLEALLLHDETFETAAHDIARAITEAASMRSTDRRARTPFAEFYTAECGMPAYRGGKWDDITVLSAWVCRKHRGQPERTVGGRTPWSCESRNKRRPLRSLTEGSLDEGAPLQLDLARESLKRSREELARVNLELDSVTNEGEGEPAAACDRVVTCSVDLSYSAEGGQGVELPFSLAVFNESSL